MREIRGKKALVTGAASGIGRALALRLAREGADLYLVDVDEPGLDEVVTAARAWDVEAIAARCDVSCPQQITDTVAAVLQQWQGLDILVNNAGVAYFGPTQNMTADQWNRLLAINLHAPIQFTCELLAVLLDRPEAHIVNVASMYGLVAMPRTAAYHASKFGLVGFTESLRAEYGGRGLGVTSLCPGMVHTNLFASAACGYQGRVTPLPPRWITTTPERVADKALRAIYGNRRLVLVTPLAYFLYYLKRLAPGLLDLAQRWRRRSSRPAAAGRRVAGSG